MKNIPVRHISNESPNIVSGRFKIRELSEIMAGNDLKHDLHRHDFYFILAVQTGNGLHEIDFINHDVSHHSIFILRPGQVHQLELKAGSIGYLAEFDTTFYHPKDKLTSQRLIKAGSKNYCALEAERFARLSRILAYMHDEYTSRSEGYTEMIKANLDMFFIEYIRQSRNPAGNQKPDSAYAQERLEEFMELLDKNIVTHKQVSQYAAFLNLSIYQLNAITKALVGKPASAMINDQILLEAKRYLLATPNQVKEIADHLGYEDISYFIRFFKKHTGFSPETFRKNFR